MFYICAKFHEKLQMLRARKQNQCSKKTFLNVMFATYFVIFHTEQHKCHLFRKVCTYVQQLDMLVAKNT